MDVDSTRLADHIARITVHPRPAHSKELEHAREYVAGCLNECGWNVERQSFDATTDFFDRLHGVNLVARHRRHANPTLPRFCVAAHLDSLPDSVGADDNASAVAALLEIARLLDNSWPANPVIDLELLVTDLEENGMLGGAYHVEQTATQNVELQGMVSLEMLGYCDHRPRSQALPRALIGKYPDTGNFIAVIGNQISGALIERFRTGMQRVANLPVETLAVPDNGNMLQATRLSDHSPFWDAGYPALMITDTSFLRNPHYHTPSDTPETLDMVFLHKVTRGCLEAVRLILAEGLVRSSR